MRAFESSIAADFDALFQGLFTGENQTFLIRGFKISMNGAVGNNAASLQMLVENSAVMHGNDANAGTLLTVPTGTLPEVLNSGTNTRVQGSFVPGATNQISVKFTRQTDASTTDLVVFWSPATQLEFTKSVPLARILDYQLVISSTGFDADALPIAVVVTDGSNNVVSVTDHRSMFNRLGRGGTLTPDPQFEFAFTDGRAENPSTSTSSTSPFEGGDKQLETMKDWMDAAMTIFKEIKGTPFWYSGGAGSWPGSMGNLRADTAHSLISGRGNIAHNITTPGRINWSRDFFVRFLSGRLTYQIQANVSTTDIVLADNEVAYLKLVRDQDVSPNLIFTNGSTIVQSVGAVAWTNVINIAVGDYIKVASEFDDKYFKILTIDSNSQVTLTENYTETSTGSSGAKTRYAYGIYGTNTGDVNRDIIVADRSAVELGENTYWLFFRDDNSSNSAKVYARFLGSELKQGETRQVSDNTTSQLLAYVGADNETQDSPAYAAAVDDFEVTRIKSVPANSLVVGQAFTIFSANDVTQYYGWISDSTAPGVGDPLLAGTGVEISLDFSIPDNETQTAVKIAAAFNALGDFASPVPTNNNLTITNTATGPSTDASNVNMGGAFEIDTVTQGKSGCLINQQNYNSTEGENLTARASKLTSMIADKTQDKTIKFCPDFETMTNTTNGGNQDITFEDSGTPVLNITMPSSSNNGSVGLTGTLSLAVNQVAYITIDRNASFSIANLAGLTVSNISAVPLDENILIFAVRFTNTSVCLWDEIEYPVGINLSSGTVSAILNENAYDEPLNVISGAPSNTNEVTGPVSAGSTLTLPNDSRDSGNPQQYIVGQGVLEIRLNGLALEEGDDWIELGAPGSSSSTFQIDIPLVVGDELALRIDTAGGFTVLSSGAGEANTGNNIGGAAAVFKSKIGVAFQFRTIKAGTNVTVVQNTNDITISSSTGGASALNVSTVAINTTIPTASGNDLWLANAAGGAIDLQMPDPALNVGKVFNIKKIDASINAITISPFVAETFDGTAGLSTTTQYSNFTISTDGTNWFIL